MHQLSNNLSDKGLLIEHLKFLLYDDNQALKLNHNLFLNGNNGFPAECEKSNSADLLVNARIQTSHNELRKILFEILNHFNSREGVKIVEKFISYFRQ